MRWIMIDDVVVIYNKIPENPVLSKLDMIKNMIINRVLLQTKNYGDFTIIEGEDGSVGNYQVIPIITSTTFKSLLDKYGAVIND